jgi:hypothetical protein
VSSIGRNVFPLRNLRTGAIEQICAFAKKVTKGLFMNVRPQKACGHIFGAPLSGMYNLQPEECVNGLRNLLVEIPRPELLPCLDVLLRQAEQGIRELQAESGEIELGSDFEITPWKRHILQLADDFEELRKSSARWRKQASEAETWLERSDIRADWTQDATSQCAHDVEKLRRRMLATSFPPFQSPRWDEWSDVSETAEADRSRHLPNGPRGGMKGASMPKSPSTPRIAPSARRDSSTPKPLRPKEAAPPESHPVDLAMYDLTKGFAKLLPSSFLTGEKWEAIWHCGVRCFGFEYWFGGDIIQAMPEMVPFGAPVRVVRLGATQRTYREMRRFISEELASVYTKDSYDGLRRNCNHFSNELVRFLLHGKQIPEEVRNQINWYRELKVLRPVIMPLLGGALLQPSTRNTGEIGTFPIVHPSSSPTLLQSGNSPGFLGCCSVVNSRRDCNCQCPGSFADLYGPEGSDGFEEAWSRSNTWVQVRTRARAPSPDRAEPDVGSNT